MLSALLGATQTWTFWVTWQLSVYLTEEPPAWLLPRPHQSLCRPAVPRALFARILAWPREFALKDPSLGDVNNWPKLHDYRKPEGLERGQLPLTSGSVPVATVPGHLLQHLSYEGL